MLKQLSSGVFFSLLCMQSVAHAEITSRLVEQYRPMFERVSIPTVIRDATTDCRAAGHPVFENLVVNETIEFVNLSRAVSDNRFEMVNWQQFIIHNLKTDPFFPEPLAVTETNMCSIYTMLKRYVNGENVRVYRSLDRSIPLEEIPFYYVWEQKKYQNGEVRPIKDMRLSFYVINGIQEKYQASDGSWVYPYYVPDDWDFPIQIRRMLLLPEDERPKVEHYTITLEEFFNQLSMNNEKSQVQLWNGLYDAQENMALSREPKNFLKMPEYEPERSFLEMTPLFIEGIQKWEKLQPEKK